MTAPELYIFLLKKLPDSNEKEELISTKKTYGVYHTKTIALMISLKVKHNLYKKGKRHD